jgi:NAD(P)-dependent dehydrogenase (short-subunit alcohol dehydrogenase family)
MNTVNGARIVVTGSTSGLGKEIASQLAALGAYLVLACRDVERGEQVAAEIARDAGAAEPEVLAVDTSSQASISDFARRYRQRFDRLDVLVNNAGVLCPQRMTSVDGIELTFATNVIGYHLMTRELLDVLRGSAAARVVNVASMYASDVDLDDLQFESRPYDGMRAYAQSKACDRMLTWALARRLADSGVTINAMAPGLVMETSLYDHVPDEIRDYLAQMPSRTVTAGADTAVWLASAAEMEGVSGEFFEQRAEQPCEFRDAGAEEKLWALCDAMSEQAAARTRA